METRAQQIARAIKAEGGNLDALEVRPTSRPLGGWRYGKAYSYGVYHPARKIALEVVDFKIQAKRGTSHQPAKGWESIDACAQLAAEKAAQRIQEEV